MKSSKGIQIEVLSGPEKLVDGDKNITDYLYDYRGIKIVSRKVETTLLEHTSVKNMFIVLHKVSSRAEIEHAKLFLNIVNGLFDIVPTFRQLKWATEYIDSIVEKGVISG